MTDETVIRSAPPDGWWPISNADEIPSPALLIYPDRVDQNVRLMVRLAGGAGRLTPHVKTHKLGAVIDAHIRHGIERFKCATIAEADMTAEAGARDVLLAYQPVGPSVARLIALARQYPETRFSVIADDEGAVRAIGAAAAADGREVPVLLDLDVGMHRTGVAPGGGARALYRAIAGIKGVVPGGLHAYDGHIRDKDITTRTARSDVAFAAVESLKRDLEAEGLRVPRVIAGGSPTFPVHARRAGVELSPGTTVLWDASYGTDLPDLPFLPSAMLLTRVVSKPGGQRVCVDLGHKAVAAENPHPRVLLINPVPGGTPATGAAGGSSRALRLPLLEATFVGHGEEHLVLETPDAARLRVGDVLYGMPWHVCPTVALHSEAVIVRDGRAVDRWPIRARARRLTV